MRVRSALIAASFVMFSSPVFAATSISAADYKLYREYQAALTDPRVQKMPETRRLGAIAKNFHVTESKLKDAITRGEAAGEVGKTEENSARVAVAEVLKDRLDSLSVDDGGGILVAYVTWKNQDSQKLEEEAAMVAARAVAASPLFATLSLAATDATGARIFEGKIDAERARSIKEDRIPLFARARYVKLFDGVKISR